MKSSMKISRMEVFFCVSTVKVSRLNIRLSGAPNGDVKGLWHPKNKDKFKIIARVALK